MSDAKNVRIDDLNLYYGDFHAVCDVTMTIAANAITAIIGSSGCGKSTFLRALNRMHEVLPGARVDGRVCVGGENIYGPRVDAVRVRRQVGMVFQTPNPFPEMSIKDNVAAGLGFAQRKYKRDEVDERVERSLERANLWEEVKDKLDRPAGGLSGGQQQRLCIARTIALEPEVVLLDEPASALDPIATGAIEELMQDLKQRYTIIVVTHNMEQAKRASDHTAFFNVGDDGPPGRLVEYGTTEKIFTSPDTDETEKYVTGDFG